MGDEGVQKGSDPCKTLFVLQGLELAVLGLWSFIRVSKNAEGGAQHRSQYTMIRMTGTPQKGFLILGNPCMAVKRVSLSQCCTWTPTVCKIITFWAQVHGYGPSFYMLWGSRYIDSVLCGFAEETGCRATCAWLVRNLGWKSGAAVRSCNPPLA